MGILTYMIAPIFPYLIEFLGKLAKRNPAMQTVHTELGQKLQVNNRNCNIKLQLLGQMQQEAAANKLKLSHK